MLIDADSVPRFRPGNKFRYDTVREAWVVLGPERMFVPDEQAAAVLKLLDGQRNVGGIVALLCQSYAATPEEVFPGVVELLEELAEKGVVAC